MLLYQNTDHISCPGLITYHHVVPIHFPLTLGVCLCIRDNTSHLGWLIRLQQNATMLQLPNINIQLSYQTSCSLLLNKRVAASVF